MAENIKIEDLEEALVKSEGQINELKESWEQRYTKLEERIDYITATLEALVRLEEDEDEDSWQETFQPWGERNIEALFEVPESNGDNIIESEDVEAICESNVSLLFVEDNEKVMIDVDTGDVTEKKFVDFSKCLKKFPNENALPYQNSYAGNARINQNQSIEEEFPVIDAHIPKFRIRGCTMFFQSFPREEQTKVSFTSPCLREGTNLCNAEYIKDMVKLAWGFSKILIERASEVESDIIFIEYSNLSQEIVLHFHNTSDELKSFKKAKNSTFREDFVVLGILNASKTSHKASYENKKKVKMKDYVTIYIGLAAYLSKFPDHVEHIFSNFIPYPLYWRTFVVDNAATIIMSQAMVSGAFTITYRSLRISCLPRVKIVHTSAKYEGQVHILEVHYLLMVACVIVTYSFKSTEKIDNPYSIAVVAVVLIPTCLVPFMMLIIWKTKIWWISSALYKFTQVGYHLLAFSLVLMTMRAIWHYSQQHRYIFELKNKVSSSYVRDLGHLAKDENIKRIPGIGLLYLELIQGIPPIFLHFISNIPSIHSVIVFISIESIPISKVALAERFLFKQVEPKEYGIFGCVTRYGYKELIKEPGGYDRDGPKLYMVEPCRVFYRYFGASIGKGKHAAKPIYLYMAKSILNGDRWIYMVVQILSLDSNQIGMYIILIPRLNRCVSSLSQDAPWENLVSFVQKFSDFNSLEDKAILRARQCNKLILISERGKNWYYG